MYELLHMYTIYNIQTCLILEYVRCIFDKYLFWWIWILTCPKSEEKFLVVWIAFQTADQRDNFLTLAFWIIAYSTV